MSHPFSDPRAMPGSETYLKCPKVGGSKQTPDLPPGTHQRPSQPRLKRARVSPGRYAHARAQPRRILPPRDLGVPSAVRSPSRAYAKRKKLMRTVLDILDRLHRGSIFWSHLSYRQGRETTLTLPENPLVWSFPRPTGTVAMVTACHGCRQSSRCHPLV